MAAKTTNAVVRYNIGTGDQLGCGRGAFGDLCKGVGRNGVRFGTICIVIVICLHVLVYVVCKLMMCQGGVKVDQHAIHTGQVKGILIKASGFLVCKIRP
jgi:hypothetical protein